MKKHSAFRVHSESPYNGEPPVDLLRENFTTPSELFYVRNHGNVPEINATTYRLVVNGMVEHPLELSLDQLKRDFPSSTLMATLQCAGNRREELMEISPIPGEVPWGAGAIGNAYWTGVPLAEILKFAGLKAGADYVAFTGMDQVIQKGKDVGFGASIPLDKAMDDHVLLAYEMNGAPLEPLHGYPLRVVTPGYIGARSVKWLTRIAVQPMASQNYFQAHAYQLFPPQATAETADWDAGLQLGELNVQCAICSPRAGEQVKGEVVVQGYALSGGGRKIARVDVSGDGGNTWTTANLKHQEHGWAWTLWEARLNVPRGQHEIVARAVDSASNAQPEDARHLWNFKGYMNNAWDRMKVRVE
ncbi:MAG TPA: molybdopterin-dependent oxidoreductase [Anaerolineae bacterium]|nr:molybdopterin-dependent oxidoreductase [Anaerolineae bacterium]